MKQCYKCSLTKPEADFYLGHNKCKFCHKKMATVWRKLRKETA